MWKKMYQVTTTPPPYGGIRNFYIAPQGKFLLCFDFGQHVIQWTENEHLLHLRLNWLKTLYSLPLLSTPEVYFQLVGFVPAFGAIEYNLPIRLQLKMIWVVLLSSLEHIYTTIKTKFRLSYFCIFYRSLWGMQTFQTPVHAGSCELISKFLSSMTLYNHPLYSKSDEINSCELSPLPNNIVIVICN